MTDYILLREYSPNEEQEYQQLIQSSTHQLPYTLASPIKQLASQLKTGNYGQIGRAHV